MYYPAEFHPANLRQQFPQQQPQSQQHAYASQQRQAGFANPQLSALSPQQMQLYLQQRASLESQTLARQGQLAAVVNPAQFQQQQQIQNHYQLQLQHQRQQTQQQQQQIQVQQVAQQRQQQSTDAMAAASVAAVAGATVADGNGTAGIAFDNKARVEQFVQDILIPEKKNNAITELSKIRESDPDFGVLLWNTPGVVTVFLQEIISVYPLLNPPILNATVSTSVATIIQLLQCIACHPQTQRPFLEASMLYWIVPFLNSNPTDKKQLDTIRLTTLSFIGNLIKSGGELVVQLILDSDIVPSCLVIAETGSILSKTLASFTLQRIMMTESGFQYMCFNETRFNTVARVLADVIQKDPKVVGALHQPQQQITSTGQQQVQKSQESSLSSTPGSQKERGRLVKLILKCFIRLADNSQYVRVLTNLIPAELTNGVYDDLYQEDNGLYSLVQELENKIKMKLQEIAMAN